MTDAVPPSPAADVSPSWQDIADWFEEAIGDSIDMDWTPRIAAELIVRRMKDGDFPVQFYAPEAAPRHD
ncbi:hypothetical protein ACFOON_15070 [Novosphingobium piscinae]|uniref:Uncharacterized protein n=1 Tax=Novosphingobium piscinae TaxID=1507448 RepID=A0A7X1FXI4_9SPHN|nr:hypothetical protein [Novosphingobium piscinae]MBC2668778.1 hypothetical protein [Novosphingobium piscinae]